MSQQVNAAWEGLVTHELLASLDETPFLSRCRAGTLGRHEAEAFLLQQHHYAKHFVRYLCALLANLTAEVDRNALLENLFEEMGYGDMGDEPHARMYRSMLSALRLDPEVSVVYPETQALVSTMLTACADPDPMVGLGALCVGAEAIVPHIYAQVVHGLRGCGIADGQLRFFALHIEGDDQHALSMKAIIDRELQKDPGALGVLSRSARECVDSRVAFFEAITHRSLRSDPHQAVARAV